MPFLTSSPRKNSSFRQPKVDLLPLSPLSFLHLTARSPPSPMTSRARPTRKAAASVSYDDPPAFTQLDSEEEEEGEMRRSGGGGKAKKEKGKGASTLTSLSTAVLIRSPNS
jgi:hypothetical protein